MSNGLTSGYTDEWVHLEGFLEDRFVRQPCAFFFSLAISGETS